MKTKLMLLISATTLSCAAPVLLAQTNTTDYNNTSAAARDQDQSNRDQFENGGVRQLGDLKKANQIIGMEIKGTDDERLGKVKDLALDLQNGRIVEVIVAKGGLLGMDEKYVAVPPSAFACDPSMKSLRLTVDKDQFKNSPEFQWSHWKDSMGDSQVREVYQRYNAQPYYGQNQSNWNNGNNLNNYNNSNTITASSTANLDSNNSPTFAQTNNSSETSNANADEKRGQASRYYTFTGNNGASSNYYYSGGYMTPKTIGPVTRATKLLGSTAYNEQNEKLGKVHNLIIDLPQGRVVEVVLASGGFLGMHDEYSAIPPEAFKWNADSDALTLNTTREALKSSPHFRGSDWNNVNDPAQITEVYTTYHVQPYFTSANNDNTAQNVRDRSGSTLTPMDQGNSQSDRDISAKIRRAVTSDPNMSVNARNVKIITRDGQVTLRGVVNSDGEKTMIAQEATSIAGADKVDNQLQVRSDNSNTTTPASSDINTSNK